MKSMIHRRLALVTCLVAAFAWNVPLSSTDTVLVAKGASWKYHDLGSNLGTSWRGTTFKDGAWPAGSAQLGYGDGDEATVVSFGPDINNKQITTYFRHAFQVSNPSIYQSLALNLMRDDGAVVYLNGTEAFRSNMPSSAISYTTPASVAIGGADESAYQSAALSPSLLTAGTNVIAVEIHQSGGTSSDISFDAELIASTNQEVTRGPYLQMGNSSSVIVRWRTSGPNDSQVLYGSSPSSLTSTAGQGALTTEHQVTLTNLLPNTRYYYAIGSSTQTLAGGDANHFFVTSPPVGASVPTRVWVVGDSGTADANARAVRNAYYNFTGSTFTNLWLMLGDNAYEQGLDHDYQAAVFDMYPEMLRQSVLWPTLGNHDGAAADSASQSGPYYNMFSLPKNAEAGGVASGTEAYYSFDYGDIHFVCLESFETSRAAGSAMMTWLEADLAATSQKWVIAYWHHPPYSKGSHNSDVDIESRDMRQVALPLLEAAGVDLVLSGHSHSYERSYLIDGHYGLSSTFTSAMQKDGGSGRTDGSGAYEKPTAGQGPHEGAVYAVAGSSGKISGGTLNHPAMYISLNVLGSMVLDVNGDRLDAKFLSNAGAILDYFSIVKDAEPMPPAITTSTLPNGVIGIPYSSTLSAAGGIQPYSWSIASGMLPAGVTLGTQDGLISGTPSGPAGGYQFDVRVTGNDGASSTKTLDLTIDSTPPPPGAFGKLSPAHNAKKQPTSITLRWNASSGATLYEYCYDTSNNGACDGTWVSAAAAPQAAIGGLSRNVNYYWQVRARNAQGTTDANNGTWWKFTTAR